MLHQSRNLFRVFEKHYPKEKAENLSFQNDVKIPLFTQNNTSLQLEIEIKQTLNMLLK